MWIKCLHLTSFQSFRDSGQIELRPGINLILGQNNVGKSAIVKCFAPSFNNHPHRSPLFTSISQVKSNVEIELIISTDEFKFAWAVSNGPLQWPYQNTTGRDPVNGIHAYFKQKVLNIRFTRHGTEFFHTSSPFHGLESGTTNEYLEVSLVDGNFGIKGAFGGSPQNFNFPMYELWNSNLFQFDAQRLQLGRAPQGYEPRLRSNAGNLPLVLQAMYGENPDLFDKLVDHVRDIFPTIGNLSVVAGPGNWVEIKVWPTRERAVSELSVGLDDCGTGVSQVIAILTVAITRRSAIIVIDEISSFLHPSAAKALLRILQTHYSDHQYIITTHSPEVISFSNPTKVHLVEKDGYESSIRTVDLTQLSELQFIAGELGISPTDVFAADRIIWVEGPTEQQCFPYLLELTQDRLKRTAAAKPQFIAAVAPSDFTGKINRKNLIFDIYDRLVTATSQLVKSVTFSFDREDLSASAMKDLEKRSKNRLIFLPRRMLECYLLVPWAIAEVISEGPGEFTATTEDVTVALTEASGGADFDNLAWLKDVDAAKLLAATFDKCSDAVLPFRKTTHSFEILKRVFAREPKRLEELVEYVHKLVDLASNATD